MTTGPWRNGLPSGLRPRPRADFALDGERMNPVPRLGRELVSKVELPGNSRQDSDRLGRVSGSGPQHGGRAGRDAAWLSVAPSEAPAWLNERGGTLSAATDLIAGMTGQRPLS